MYPFNRAATSPNNSSQFTFLYPNNNNNYLPSNFPWERQVDTNLMRGHPRSAENYFSSVNNGAYNSTESASQGVTFSSQNGHSYSQTMSLNFGRYTFSHSNGETTFSENCSKRNGPLYVFHGHENDTGSVCTQSEALSTLCPKRQRSMEFQPEPNTNSSHDINMKNSYEKSFNQQNNIMGNQNTLQTLNFTDEWNHLVSVNRCQKRTVKDAQIGENDVTWNPSKQFITEDKVAAQLNNLHLSNDHCYTSNGLPSINHQACHRVNGSSFKDFHVGKRPSSELFNDECSQEKEEKPKKRDWKDLSWEINPAFKDIPRISGLPKCLLEEMNKPCLAVVPWKPPEDLVDQICNQINRDKRHEDSDGKENVIEEEIIYTYQLDMDEIAHGYDSLTFSLDDSSDDVDMDEFSL